MQIYFKMIDHVYCKVIGDKSAIATLADQMTFEVPGAKFHPKVRSGQWDGNIRLINSWTGMMYSGLIDYAADIARGYGFDVEIDDQYHQQEFTIDDAKQFIESLTNLPFQPEQFQLSTFIHGIRTRRALMISPTSSGKSFMMYLMTRYFDCKTLIIVPRQQLALQMKSDFVNYGYDSDIHIIMKGADKNTDAPIVISTWQSIYKMPSSYFDQFGAIIGDEVHTFSAKCLKEMMEKTISTPIKIGLTGSLDDSKTNKLVLMGLFGPVYQTTTTKQLIEANFVSDLTIKVFVFNYQSDQLKTIPRERRILRSGKIVEQPPTYQAETDFILAHPTRNKFIRNLVASVDGNSIVLFRKIDKHGDILLNLLEKGNKPVYYIHGTVNATDREAFRQIAEQQDGVIGLASDGTFSTGTSINNIQHVFKVNPLKSVVNNLQSIGRGLRRDGKDNHFTLYDLADDLSVDGSSDKGYLYKHLLARLKIYAKEGFRVKIYKIELSDGGRET